MKVTQTNIKILCFHIEITPPLDGVNVKPKIDFVDIWLMINKNTLKSGRKSVTKVNQIFKFGLSILIMYSILPNTLFRQFLLKGRSTILMLIQKIEL